MLKRLSLLVILVFAGLAAYVAAMPSTSVVTRTATLKAAPEMIFPHVNTFKKWEAWSPWRDLDKDAKTAYDGPESGVGSIMKWSGNNDVGSGALAITESEAPRRMVYRIDFSAPMTSTSTGEFLLSPQPSGGTDVTWKMTSERGFVARLVTTVLGVDAQIGGMFDKGLNDLGVVAASSSLPAPEASAKPPT